MTSADKQPLQLSPGMWAAFAAMDAEIAARRRCETLLVPPSSTTIAGTRNCNSSQKQNGEIADGKCTQSRSRSPVRELRPLHLPTPNRRVIDMTHKHWQSASDQRVRHLDFLKAMYPHARDSDCVLNESTHTYLVHGETYKYSVSSVWKVFFETFNSANTAAFVLQRAAEEGLRDISTTVYNLYMALLMLKQLMPDSHSFWAAFEETLTTATEYNVHDEQIAEMRQSMRDLLSQSSTKAKPSGSSCYFLVFCANMTANDLQTVWHIHGEVEALKGTILHKRIELYIQALAEWEYTSHKRYVPLAALLLVPNLAARARNAASPRNAMATIVDNIAPSLWDHAAVQLYLNECVTCEHDLEFKQFESWLSANPSLTPYRTEWSIYDEDAGVAGQIDSLWIDCSDDSLHPTRFVMADWKRSRHTLSSDVRTHDEQSFGKLALQASPFAVGIASPCQHLHDCAYNHYKVQQHLYSDFLRRKYGIEVASMRLVQCHPLVVPGPTLFHEADIPHDYTLATAVLNAFASGWAMHLEKAK